MRLIIMLFLMIWVHNEVTAQNDTLIMNSGHLLVGEIKGFDQGVVTIETAFSDSDFHVEWDKVKNFSTEQRFLIITSEGKRYFGSLATDKNDPSRVTINDKDAGNIIEKTADIIFFKQIEDTFWSRADLSVSLGFTKTKANNNTQLSINVQTGYLSSNFKADIYFAAIKNLQEVDTIATRTNRTEGGLGFLYFVYKDWFSVTRADLLSSSEQLLNIRAITKAGLGHYVVKTNRMNLGIAAGVAWNFEDYDELDNSDRNSAEGFLAAEYIIFDLGDLDLNTKIIAYPSFTESGRFRTDFNFSVKYEFDFDLFFKVGYKLNYDNMPVAGGSSKDYVIETSIGWEL